MAEVKEQKQLLIDDIKCIRLSSFENGVSAFIKAMEVLHSKIITDIGHIEDFAKVNKESVYGMQTEAKKVASCGHKNIEFMSKLFCHNNEFHEKLIKIFNNECTSDFESSVVDLQKYITNTQGKMIELEKQMHSANEAYKQMANNVSQIHNAILGRIDNSNSDDICISNITKEISRIKTENSELQRKLQEADNSNKAITLKYTQIVQQSTKNTASLSNIKQELSTCKPVMDKFKQACNELRAHIGDYYYSEKQQCILKH